MNKKMRISKAYDNKNIDHLDKVNGLNQYDVR